MVLQSSGGPGIVHRPPRWGRLLVAAASAGRDADALRELETAIAIRDPMLQVRRMLPHTSDLVAVPGAAERFDAIRAGGGRAL